MEDEQEPQDYTKIINSHYIFITRLIKSQDING
jgi:hypothetical protein